MPEDQTKKNYDSIMEYLEMAYVGAERWMMLKPCVGYQEQLWHFHMMTLNIFPRGKKCLMLL